VQITKRMIVNAAETQLTAEVVRIRSPWQYPLPVAKSKAQEKRGPTSVREYRALAEFRHRLRKFLTFSEEAIQKAGIQPQQYLLMLAIKGLPPGMYPNITTLAQRLVIEHHSMVELVNRAVARGLLLRTPATRDRRHVLVTLSPQGERLLKELARVHRDKLREGAPGLARALAAIGRPVTQARQARKK
jgi:DNA-binding MarR family transcriptional regulator